MVKTIKKIISVILYAGLMYFVYNIFIPEHGLFKKADKYLKKEDDFLKYENLTTVTKPKTNELAYHLIGGIPSNNDRPRFACQSNACHTNYPHKKNTDTRAFYNMHAIRISCLACHIEPADKEKIKLGWFDAKGNFIVNGSSINNTILAPYKMIDNFAAIFEQEIKAHNDLTDKFQISIANRTELKCKNCHTKSGTLFFDLGSLGYTQEHVNKLRNLDEAGMYDRQEKWIYPDFL